MKYLFIALLALILVACEAPPPEKVANGIRVVGNDGNGALADVQEIKLSDGTRCAILIGYQKGSITCEWQPDVVIR